MAYDARKAHEYYEKYKKKDLKKGRKKKTEVPKKNTQAKTRENNKSPRGTTKKLKMYKNSNVQKGGKIMNSGSSTYAFEDKAKAAEAKAAKGILTGKPSAHEASGSTNSVTHPIISEGCCVATAL